MSWTIIAAAIVTYGTRIGGHLVLSRFKRIPPRIDAALNAVPAAVLTTLVAPAAVSNGSARSNNTGDLPADRPADPDDGYVRHRLGGHRGAQGCRALIPGELSVHGRHNGSVAALSHSSAVSPASSGESSSRTLA